jgi:hypothetical protein
LKRSTSATLAISGSIRRSHARRRDVVDCQGDEGLVVLVEAGEDVALNIVDFE